MSLLHRRTASDGGILPIAPQSTKDEEGWCVSTRAVMSKENATEVVSVSKGGQGVYVLHETWWIRY